MPVSQQITTHYLDYIGPLSRGEKKRMTFFFLLFRVILAAYGGSQARGQIGATTAGLRHSHSHVRSEPRLQPQLRATMDP